VQVETRFVRIRKPVELGDEVEGQPVCWVGGWDKGRVFFLVMVIAADQTCVRDSENQKVKSTRRRKRS
jgi:hypothetical protein